MRPHRRQPTRLRHPWDSPGKNTGVGCHFLLQCMKVRSESEVAQSCLTLSNRMDCSPPGSSVHGFSRQEYWSGVPLPSLIYGASSKEFACQARDARDIGSIPVEKIPWSRKWHPTPVFLPGEFHGQRILAGYSARGCRESDTTEHRAHGSGNSQSEVGIHRQTRSKRVAEQGSVLISAWW